MAIATQGRLRVAVLGLLLLASAGHAASEDSGAALKAADASLQKAVADRDLGRIMSFYADDAVLLPAAEPIVVGKNAIEAEWKHILSIPAFQNQASLTKVDVSGSGDMAYTMGTYVARMTGQDGSPVTEPGKWLSVWRKQADGQWRIVVDTYNTDVPPPDHK